MFKKLLISLLVIGSAKAATIYPGGTTGSGGAAGGGFMSSLPVYVATTGNDANDGAKATPVATPQQAATLLGGSGTIIMRGGFYFNSLNLSNCYSLEVRNYNNELPKYISGTLVASNSFTLLSNGIFTTTLTGHALGSLISLTNWWDNWSPTGRGIYLWQTNVPYGTNDFMWSGLSPISRSGDTNRIEHTPLYRAVSIASMMNSNGCWAMSGTTLYVKFASSNVMGGIYISDTNFNTSFVYGGTEATHVKVTGIASYFGRNGFDYSGCGKAEFRRCLAVGCGFDGFSGDDAKLTTFTGDADILHCEAAGCNGFQFHACGEVSHVVYSSVRREGNYWHDYLREAASARQSVFETVTADMAFGGAHAQYGYIDDAGHSVYINCYAASNSVGNWQMGQVNGWSSVQRVFDPVTEGGNLGLLVEDFNSHLWVVGGYFNNVGGAISIAGNNSSHSGRVLGAMYSTSQATDIISSPESLNTARYQVAYINYGWGTSANAGGTAYGAPSLVHENGLFDTDMATLGTLRSLGTATAVSLTAGSIIDNGTLTASSFVNFTNGVTLRGGAFNAATNTAPASAVLPVGWIVHTNQANGESYRIPTYK